jgi:ankyrin repeat protein
MPTNIIPKEKNIVSYRSGSVPSELLESRSFQNRHIPKVMTNKDRANLLEKIIEYGMIAELRAVMLELRDANSVMENQYTLLTYATKHKQYDIMNYLIHIGANPSKRDERLDTPLIVAVKNNDLNAVKILMNANANPNMIDILRRTPLIYAIEQDFENVALFLIDNGADINITNGVGEGTLSMSVRLGRNSVRQRIIDVLTKDETPIALVR